MKPWTLLGEYCGVVKTARQSDEGAGVKILCQIKCWLQCFTLGPSGSLSP